MKNISNKYAIEESYPMLIAACAKLLSATLNSQCTALGITITPEQWDILTYLSHYDGVSQQNIADGRSRSKVAVFRLVGKLEKQGYITRKPDPEDHRSNLVFLTEEGRNIQEKIVPLARENSERRREGVTDEELDQLKTILRKIRKNLSK